MFDFFRAIRIPNVLLVAGAQILILNKYDSFSYANILLVILTMLWIMWGNIDNDLKDIDLDTVHKRKPKNTFIQWLNMKSRARRLEQILLSLSLTISVFLSTKAIIFSILAWSCLKYYNLYWKKMPLIGNLVIALLCTLSIHVFFISIDKPIYLISALIFTATLLREFVKDKEDENADMACGYRTLAIIVESNAFKFILLFLGIILTCIAFLHFQKHSYLFITFLLLQFFQLYCIYGENWKKTSLAIKLQILLGVVSIGIT